MPVIGLAFREDRASSDIESHKQRGGAVAGMVVRDESRIMKDAKGFVHYNTQAAVEPVFQSSCIPDSCVLFKARDSAPGRYNSSYLPLGNTAISCRYVGASNDHQSRPPATTGRPQCGNPNFARCGVQGLSGDIE